jgi:hypothetical protein
MISFTGIANPYALGAYSIEKNVQILQRYRYLHEALARTAAGQLPARGDWDLKLGLCRHLYEDAEAAESLRKRIPQMRTSAAVLNKEPDPCLTLLMDELIHARNDYELAVGIYGIIRPAMLAAYRNHMARTQQIVDQPTIRVLRQAAYDLEEQVRWGEELLEALRSAGAYDEAATASFAAKLQACLDAAGGVDGQGERSKDIPVRDRSREPYRLPHRSVRDPRSMGPTTLARTGSPLKTGDPVERELVMKMRVRQEEMTACELIAAVYYSQRNMPWGFYYDLARHIWDEARHAMFGQAALEADGYEWKSRPQYTSDYDVNAPKLPGAQYTWLSIGIEEGAMISNGKKKEYEWCRDVAKHPLMAQFQDYDWADEVVHANFGRRWSPELMGEELPFVREVAKRELDHFWGEVGAAQQQWEAEAK